MSLLDLLDEGLCRYGNPKVGEVRPCSGRVTHRAVWHIPDTHADGTPNARAGTGGVECCLHHANYYAEAWCSFWLYPNSCDVAWVEVLVPGRAVRGRAGLWRWEVSPELRTGAA